jgi:hypothetical protein
MHGVAGHLVVMRFERRGRNGRGQEYKQAYNQAYNQKKERTSDADDVPSHPGKTHFRHLMHSSKITVQTSGADAISPRAD